MSVDCLGAYYDSVDDYVYSFLSNGTNSYLAYTDKDSVEWRYAEGSSIASCTAFDNSNKAFFTRYGSSIIFTKNETQTVNGASGGTFYINASGQIRLYGTANNPTGKCIATHKERVWVGNITALSGQTQDGESWVQVSKYIPEDTDTRISIVNSGIVFGEGTAQIIIPSHTYKVGDEVYLSGIVFSGVQDDMNQRLFSVVGLNGSGIVIEYNNVNDLTWASGGDALLRGPTWGTSLSIYDDELEGAGLFRCDDDDSDAVLQLKSSFGALTIYREKNPYIFTGAIESGDQTLARPLNVTYGVVSPFVYSTAGGTWFVSQYGISKVEGTTIKTNTNALDNIVDITVVEPIRPTYEAITTKSNLLVHGMDRRVLIHDRNSNITYALDTYNGQWSRWYGRLVDRYIDIGEDAYSVYKHLLFKLNDGYQTFDMTTYGMQNISSSYKLAVKTQGALINTKTYNMLASLLEGTATTAETNDITINLYYNGKATPSKSFTWDIKTDTLETWGDVTTTGTVTWGTVTTAGTVLWSTLLGNLLQMIRKRKYHLGSATAIQIEIQHSDNSGAKVSQLYLDYDMLDIDTIQ